MPSGSSEICEDKREEAGRKIESNCEKKYQKQLENDRNLRACGHAGRHLIVIETALRKMIEIKIIRNGKVVDLRSRTVELKGVGQ